MLPLTKNGADDFQTPHEALLPLLQFIPEDWIVWEPACGNGNLCKAFAQSNIISIGTDILSGVDFLTAEPWFPYDAIVTNPPYSLKNQFLQKCYEYQKPFALLLPLTALETKKRQLLYKQYGLELLLLPKRIAFETPSGGKSSPWFAVMWLTWGLNIGKELTFS